jgi:nucleolin
MSYNTDEDSLRRFFGSCGSISSCRIAKDADGYAKGFAHIDFDIQDSATKACELNGSDLDGRNVYVEYA